MGPRKVTLFFPNFVRTMCGILTYYKSLRSGGLRREDLDKALAALRALKHRGPDGEGVVLINSETGATAVLRTKDTPPDIHCSLTLESHTAKDQYDLLLAHRRLSIFDLSSKGHQPMFDPFGNILCFNGEVYNWPELRTELQAKGYSFQSETDTEVILASYREWGPDALKRFNGMWSMFLWDAQRKQLLYSNDRIGIKQLYTWSDAESHIVASEIKAIRVIRGGGLTPNLEAARYFVLNGNLDLNAQTMFNEVHRLAPAHWRLCRPADFPRAKAQRYWDFPVGKRFKGSLADATAQLRHLLEDAIKVRMRSDVPWGTTLSGGLDSSSIIYAANKIRKQQGVTTPINTFTAIFPGQEGDESRFVREIEADLGLNARYTNPLEKFDFDDFQKFLQHQDQPVASTSMYAQWCVMKMVGDSEVKVLLDGQGGDELFAGYHHHVYKYGRDLLLRGKFKASRELIREYSELKGMNPNMVKKIIWNDARLWLRLKLGKRMPGPPENTTWNVARTLPEVLRLDMTSWVMPMLLRYEDRNSMAFSIEARLPFLDYRIVEFAMQVPDEYKIHKGWQKYVLRQAMEDLPDGIRWRKDKKGFTTPHDDWVSAHRDAFLAFGEKAVDAGILVPVEGKSLSDLNAVHLFRMASLGAWVG